MEKEKFELIIPERIFIINSLKEAREIIEKYNLYGVTIRKLKTIKMENIKIETKEQPCLVEQAMEEAKRLGKPNQPICVSCPCPKCSPRC